MTKIAHKTTEKLTNIKLVYTSRASFSHQVWGSMFFSSPGVGTFSHGVGDHFSFSSDVNDMALLMALLFS
jgi:hypothetical protein